MEVYPAVIIGAGPSGLAAAIQLKRQGIDCLVLEKSSPGGLLKNANLVENYPGFPNGIRGPELAKLIVLQAEQNDVRIVKAEVTALSFEDDRFVIKTNIDDYFAQIVLIASGTRPKSVPGLIIPDDCADRVHYEMHELDDLQNKRVVIIGAGDAAFDYALNLFERDNQVTILNRKDKSVALALLRTRVLQSEKITYQVNSSVKSMSKRVAGGLLLDVSQGDGQTQIETDHLLIAIGREPADYFLTVGLKNQLSRLQAERRLYIVGDLTAGIFRQTSIATGEAVRAAMMIGQKLEGLS